MMCLKVLSVKILSSLHPIQGHFPMLWHFISLILLPIVWTISVSGQTEHQRRDIWFSNIIHFSEHLTALHHGIVIGNVLHTIHMVKLMLHCCHTNSAHYETFLFPLCIQQHLDIPWNDSHIYTTNSHLLLTETQNRWTMYNSLLHSIFYLYPYPDGSPCNMWSNHETICHAWTLQ
jgi:hypothetical protein